MRSLQGWHLRLSHTDWDSALTVNALPADSERCIRTVRSTKGTKKAAKIRAPNSKFEARQGLEEAMTSLVDLALQLEDAILAAFDAGLEEDELLPAFKRLEELRGEEVDVT
eukprot:symbB.v1.2.023015.t1/scaffold2079.1/size90222/8